MSHFMMFFMGSGGSSAPDTTAPTLAWTIAANGLSAIGVSPESLDDSVTLDDADFVFSGPSGTAPSISSVSYQTTTNADDTVRVVFATPWYAPEGTGITVDIAAGAVEDLAGNQLAAVTGGAVTNGSTVWPSTVVGAFDASDVATSGSNVTQMNDVSGQSNHITSAGADPTIDDATYGVPVVTFNGTSHEMSLPAAWCSHCTSAQYAPASAILSMRFGASALNVMQVGASNTNHVFRLRVSNVASTVRMSRHDGTTEPLATSNADYPTATWFTLGAFASSGAASFSIGDSTTKAGGGALVANAPTSSTRGHIGSRGGAGFLPMSLARMVLCDSDVTGRDLAVLQTWAHETTLAA